MKKSFGLRTAGTKKRKKMKALTQVQRVFFWSSLWPYFSTTTFWMWLKIWRRSLWLRRCQRRNTLLGRASTHCGHFSRAS